MLGTLHLLPEEQIDYTETPETSNFVCSPADILTHRNVDLEDASVCEAMKREFEKL